MRSRSALLLFALGVLPPLLFGGMHLLDTTERARDPCTTWGDRTGGPQEGGGVAPGPPGCEAGTQWTTQSRAGALLAAARMPGGALLALGLGVAAWARRAPLAGYAGAVVVFWASAHLGLGATLPLVFWGPAFFAAGARRAGPDEGAARVARRLLGGAAAVLGAATVVAVAWQVVVQGAPPAFLIGAAFAALGFGAVALVALWPRP